ncbi:ribonuclease P protein component [Candidatus Bipolaricaulota bacterium]|nr:ribonuclease P protein component [Candidatus Bipolaricaulota bacterium]
MSRNDFPKDNRLLSRRDFSRVYRKGQFLDSDGFVFYILKKEDERPRLGVVTPKKLGNAVERNRVKRVIRESFRKNKSRFSRLDLIVKPKRRAVFMDNSKLSEDFLNEFNDSNRGGNNGEYN